MRKFKAEYITSGIFLCVIIGFMFSAVWVFASWRIETLTTDEPEIKIDWEALYPFEDTNVKNVKSLRKETLIEKAYAYIKEKFTDYSSERLFCYQNIIESAKRYENAVKWNMASMSDYNAVVKLHDGYLTTYTPSMDITESANAITGLAEFCRQRGIDFFYANLPTKICISEDKNISGVLDFANQNADRFLAMLNDAGVRNYDFRKLLHEGGMNHHEAFYVTDHHWKTETGLWAARHILRILRDDYAWNVNPDVLNPDRFNYVIYPEWLLGTQGKKFTLVRTKPDDLTMIYPKYETYLHYEIPDKVINKSGDFSVVYDFKQVKEKDYYHRSPYHVYGYGDRPFIRSKNNLIRNGKRLLIIRDSFSDCVLPFLYLGIENVDAIDIRHFDGSLISFICKENPETVIVAYTADRVAQSEPEQAGYRIMFDFR